MAGKGPAPQAVRRRRNEPARGEWIDLPPLAKPVLGKLPARSRGEEPWSKRARATWEAWRTDPVTQMWSPADLAYAGDALELYELMPGSASEVRLRMDSLGLTPKGRRDLRWRIGEAAGDVPARAPRPPAASARRTRLSVVK
jgi:hypothetical protein